MATTLIRNGFFAGALSGLLSGRRILSATPSDFAGAVNQADAVAAQCLTANAALGVPMADADNASIAFVCQATARAYMENCEIASTTATDYLQPAQAMVAAAKQSVAKLV